MGVTVNACSGSGVYVVVGTGVVEDFGSRVFAGVWVGVNADSGLCVGVGSGDFERVGVRVIVGFGVGVLVAVGMMVRIGRRVGVPVGVRVINLCGSTTVAVFEIGLVCGDGVIVRVGVGELVGNTGVGVDCVRAVTISLGSSPAVGVGCWLLQVTRTRHKIAQCVIHSRPTMRGRNELGVVGMRIGIQNRCNSLIGILVVRATTIHAAKLKRMGALGRSSQLRLWGLSLRSRGVLHSHPI